MILELDIGNSRVKWRTLAAGAVTERGHCERGAPDWPALLPQRGVEQVRVANVGGAEAAEQLTCWAQAHWGLTPGYAQSLPALAGVTNAYREPARLGVDRWLALLAAWRELRAGAVLVSAGTALTIDVLYDNGQHGGGYIVPGLRLMRDALISGTSGVRLDFDRATTLAPGHSTAEAVLHGCTAMAVTLIDKVRADTAGPAILTGGDAPILGPWLAEPVLQRPDLVLDGLVTALP